MRRDRLGRAGARRRGDRGALRRHRRGGRQRRRRAGGHDSLDRPRGLRADTRDQPLRRVADRALLPAAGDRAQGLCAGDSIARRRPARARNGRLRRQQGRRRGVCRLAARRGQAPGRRRRRGLLRLHRHGPGASRRRSSRDGHAAQGDALADREDVSAVDRRRGDRDGDRGAPPLGGRPELGARDARAAYRDRPAGRQGFVRPRGGGRRALRRGRGEPRRRDRLRSSGRGRRGGARARADPA